MSIDSSASIDPTARIEADVEIGPDVVIGPWSIIRSNVSIGAGTILRSHVVIQSNSRIGGGNLFFQFGSIGEDPQDRKYQGEETWLEIGENNIFREGVTVHRGTGKGGGVTRIGNRNLLMAYSHVAHDCKLGDDIVCANNVGLCGHVTIDDFALLGGYAGVNQFLHIGAHSMVGGMTHVINDVPAFVIVSGQPALARSVNSIGMKRRGFEREDIELMKKAFKILHLRKLTLQEAVPQIRALSEDNKAMKILIESVESSRKGIHR